MQDREHRALDGYQLIPRALHQVTEPDMAAVALGVELAVDRRTIVTSPVLEIVRSPAIGCSTLNH